MTEPSSPVTAELLPCPFCGGKPIWQAVKGGQAANFDLVYRVNCSECYRIDMPYWSDQADCIKQWNARTPARSSAAIGDMRSALAEEIKTAADDDLNGEFLFMIVDTIMQKFEVSRRNSPKTPANIKRPIQGWEVDVRLNGTTALTIGHNHLSGMENIDEFADEVETCARHLLSFIGRFGDVAQGSWMPIETAPKDGTEIILYEDFEPIICKGYWSTDGDEWRHNRGGFWKQPTHWMPKPAAPAISSTPRSPQENASE